MEMYLLHQFGNIWECVVSGKGSYHGHFISEKLAFEMLSRLPFDVSPVYTDCIYNRYHFIKTSVK